MSEHTEKERIRGLQRVLKELLKYEREIVYDLATDLDMEKIGSAFESASIALADYGIEETPDEQ